MVVLTIHLNGTHADDLFTALFGAREAVSKAIKAVGKTALNRRDYYLQGPDAIEWATGEHCGDTDGSSENQQLAALPGAGPDLDLALCAACGAATARSAC